MKVEVAFALESEQKILALQVDDECSAYDAVIKSGIVELYPQIDPDSIPMGIFGKAIKDPRSVILKDGQRVELYRPLIADPKVIRAKRAAKMKAAKEAEERAAK